MIHSAIHSDSPAEAEQQLDVVARLADLVPTIAATAASFGVSELDLRLRTGLHLPLLWEVGAWGDTKVITQEVTALAESIRGKTRPYLYLQDCANVDRASQLTARKLSEAEVGSLAFPVLQRFHYLNSFRFDSVHFGLFAGGNRIAAVATVSPFDLYHLAPAFARAPWATVFPYGLRVLSRVYAFRWAPRNSISTLLAFVQRWLTRHEPNVQALLTYVNPNLGLSGASYRASGWTRFCSESGTSYAYLDRSYVTHRELTRMTQLHRRGDMMRVLGQRLVFTSRPLKPLDVYVRLCNQAFQIPRHFDQMTISLAGE